MLLEVLGVTKSFGGLKAVDDVSFNMEKGKSSDSSALTVQGKLLSSTSSQGSWGTQTEVRCALMAMTLLAFHLIGSVVWVLFERGKS